MIVALLDFSLTLFRSIKNSNEVQLKRSGKWSIVIGFTAKQADYFMTSIYTPFVY